MNSELITKKIYEEHQDEFLEGCSSIEEQPSKNSS